MTPHGVGRCHEVTEGSVCASKNVTAGDKRVRRPLQGRRPSPTFFGDPDEEKEELAFVKTNKKCVLVDAFSYLYFLLRAASLRPNILRD